ncbi:cysteine methyltransferase [Aliikangiella marina]|uniref:Cysteine methyltransferase n=1 Tax=Aliikangiella marina TaxID=1712262 RepID=A0A545TC14_9GAMM|nr:MGMT family protein [Aliikangiella marina]TQV74731.1 cysteine methyltransferase [Aliikangiella marina]
MSQPISKQERIYRTVALIPRGKVASYGQIADLAGLPGRARLVGKSLREAPSSLNLPWHRVLRSSGHLAFDVNSENAQRQKLRLMDENVVVLSNKVDLSKYAWQPELGELLSMAF